MAKPTTAVAMKRLVFSNGLMSPSLDGSKSFTVRKYRAEAHNFKKGEIAIGEFMDGLDILIKITADTFKRSFRGLKHTAEVQKLGLVTNLGFEFDENYFNDLKSYYPDLTWNDTGAVISFEVLKINGVPAVQHNKHAKTE